MPPEITRRYPNSLVTVTFVPDLENMTMCMCMESEIYLEKFQKFISFDYEVITWVSVALEFVIVAKFIYTLNIIR